MLFRSRLRATARDRAHGRRPLAERYGPSRPCRCCGEPTRDKHGYCRRTPECRRLRATARERALGSRPLAERYGPSRPCLYCGEPTRSKYGYCQRTSQCRWLGQIARQRAHGRPPKYMVSGECHPSYAGGREVLCEVCLAPAGWRKPNELRSNKTGFRCKVHRYVRFKTRKEQENDSEDHGKKAG